MQRRSLLRLASLLPAALFTSRYLGARTLKPSIPRDYRKLAVQLDQLAANIQTPADARNLVDFLSDLFADNLPSAWTTNRLLNQIAQAEFAAVSNPQNLIPEQRIAEAWNIYATTINAPADFQISTAEVHNLRDALYTTSRELSYNQQNIWTVASIYSTQPDGTLTPCCRPIESIRILWDMANMRDSITATRERVQKNMLLSELFPQDEQRPHIRRVSHVSLITNSRSNPLEDATRQHIQSHGTRAFNKTVRMLLNNTLA